MIINAIKLRIATPKGEYGFFYKFSKKLTIIRGSNSSGKSTLVNCLLYSLGMEELVGGKGERILPYAVKDYFEDFESRIEIIASEIFIEIENSKSEIITLRRSIRDETRDSRLIEIFSGPYLTEDREPTNALPTFLHDPGGAQKQEGFHRYLEKFLNLNLPRVPTSNGGETKLYLQAIFAALAVEQKRGWTDYVANIPFFGIRDAKTKVVEYLLGLNVFETSSERNRLNIEAVAIDNEWRRVADELNKESAEKGVSIDGISAQPNSLFDPTLVLRQKQTGSNQVSFHEYISSLRSEYELLKSKADNSVKLTGVAAINDINLVTDEIQKLSVLHERVTSDLTIQKGSLREYQSLLAEAREDLARNKTAAKLRELGAKHAIELAVDICPTCHQSVEDTLLLGAISGPQMDLASNIGYLESQSKMLQRQLNGLQDGIRKSEVIAIQLGKVLSEKHDQLSSMRGDLSNSSIENRSIVRRQVQIELEVESLQKFDDKVAKQLLKLKDIANRLLANQASRKNLPHEYYTFADKAKISIFEKMFRANAGSFGYKSATISEVEISVDTLVPSLAQMELREIITKKIKTDLKADSSASDFVRLIWSYLLALYQTSTNKNVTGNHPGILIFDEPGQHSMAVESQHALLQHLAGENGLQSIVAASFDENEPVFREATDGVDYQLIQWEGKLIKPIIKNS